MPAPIRHLDGLSRLPGDNRRFARSRNACDQMPVRRDRLRPADQIALNFRSLFRKQRPLRLGLHALGDDG